MWRTLAALVLPLVLPLVFVGVVHAQDPTLEDGNWMNLPQVAPEVSAHERGITSLFEPTTRNIVFVVTIDALGRASNITLVDPDGATERTLFQAQQFVVTAQYPPAGGPDGAPYRARTVAAIGPSSAPGQGPGGAAPPTVRIVVAVGAGRTGGSSGSDAVATQFTGGRAGAEPVWEQTFSFDDFNLVYPRRAYRRRQNGVVELDCVIQDDRRLGCAIVREEPGEWGFGEAAQKLAGQMVAAPQLRNGDSAQGFRFVIPFEFRARR